MSRELLKQLRPKIPTLIEDTSTSVAEQFQNLTLRPILKLQHELLVAIFHQYIKLRKGTFHQLSDKMKLEYIRHSIQEDAKFKAMLIGLVVGHFTISEWQLYSLEEKELRRRLVELIIQRVQSHFAVEDMEI